MRHAYERTNAESFSYPSGRMGRDEMFGSGFSEAAIDRPMRRRRRRSLPWGGITVAVASAFGLIYFDVDLGRGDMPDAAQTAAVVPASLPAPRHIEPVPVAAPVVAAPAPAELPDPPAAQQPEEQAASPAPASIEAKAEAAEPLPPPVVDKSDIYQVRALAAGLHPGLTHDLLMRLSKTDFSNAAYAIRTALAKTPDDKVFVWPRRKRKGQVRFKVGFVPGAIRDCRRYVVQVIKDGWATTARPMEKCGTAKAAKAGRKTALRK